MNDFCACLLNRLISKYNSSVLSKTGSKRNLKIKLAVTDSVFSEYRGRGAFKHIERIDNDLAVLEEKKFIFINRDGYGRLVSVELNINAVEEVQKAIGYENRDEVLKRIIDTFNIFTKIDFVVDFAIAEVDYIKQTYKWHKSFYGNEKELAAILKVLNAMVSQTEEIMERDFSVRVLGDSKAFTSLKSKIIAIVKRFDNALVLGDEDTDKEILLNYNIVKNSTYALIKGDLNFQLNDQLIELKKLGFEYSLSDAIKKKRLLNFGSFYRILAKNVI